MGSRHQFSDAYNNSDTSSNDSGEETDSTDCEKNSHGKFGGGVMIKRWDQVYVLICFTGLFIDPLFFYAFSVSEPCMCVFVDGWFAVTVTVVRCMTDILHVANMWWRYDVGVRRHDRKPCNVAEWVLTVALKGFLFDFFVILPIPQVYVYYIYIYIY